eukprot:6496164-Ditylum_brightwellii.AAC.1
MSAITSNLEWGNYNCNVIYELSIDVVTVQETQVRTCIEEASGSAEPSDHSTYGMPPCCTDYRSGCLSQFAEISAIRLDPV